jgi:hypothetical protein
MSCFASLITPSKQCGDRQLLTKDLLLCIPIKHLPQAELQLTSSPHRLSGTQSLLVGERWRFTCLAC